MDTIAAWFACWIVVTAACLLIGWLRGSEKDRSGLRGWGMD